MALDPLTQVVLDDKAFAFETGHTFRGLTISENGEGFNIVLRAFDREGTPLYCMVKDNDPLEGLRTLLGMVSNRGGDIYWHFDKFYNR